MGSIAWTDRRYGWRRDGAFAQRGSAAGANKLVQFAGREHQQEPLTHGLRLAAFRTIKLAGRKILELLLHGLKFHDVP